MTYALEWYLPLEGCEGTAVRYIGSLFLRADEICFLVFEGASGDAVAEAAQRAAIAFERVVEVDVG